MIHYYWSISASALRNLLYRSSRSCSSLQMGHVWLVRNHTSRHFLCRRCLQLSSSMRLPFSRYHLHSWHRWLTWYPLASMGSSDYLREKHIYSIWSAVKYFLGFVISSSPFRGEVNGSSIYSGSSIVFINASWWGCHSCWHCGQTTYFGLSTGCLAVLIRSS